MLSLSDLAPINANEYLGGLLDFTGELARYVRVCVCVCVCVCVMFLYIHRYAVAAATRRDVECVLKCHDTVEQILGKVYVCVCHGRAVTGQGVLCVSGSSRYWARWVFSY